MLKLIELIGFFGAMGLASYLTGALSYSMVNHLWSQSHAGEIVGLEEVLTAAFVKTKEIASLLAQNKLATASAVSTFCLAFLLPGAGFFVATGFALISSAVTLGLTPKVLSETKNAAQATAAGSAQAVANSDSSNKG